MPAITELIKKAKQVNREYLLLFFIVILLGFLIYTSTGRTQSPPEEITLTTYYPSPFGEFNRLICNIMLDYDNVQYYCDPSGDSHFNSLTVETGITTASISGPSGYSINFGTGNMHMNNVVAADRLIMGSTGPTTQKDGGKYVYDISESIPAEDCAPADVAVIGTKGASWGLVKSGRKFDETVAGVISSDPKIIMGKGEGHSPLALAGIVKCNVCAENGPVARGDLLVTSSTPGYAMRAEAKNVKPGMLVGKALQELKEEKGQIFILVNKQ